MRITIGEGGFVVERLSRGVRMLLNRTYCAGRGLRDVRIAFGEGGFAVDRLR